MPLGPGPHQSRLLELEARLANIDTDIIEGNLQVVSLEDAPTYVALSYCWGGKAEDKVLRINGKDIRVTANLESALRHLRATSERLLIWVDAICVNQHDLIEKSAQVAQMHVIYHKAKLTVAWLGDSDDDGEFAVDFLRWFAESPTTDSQVHWDRHNSALGKEHKTREWRAVKLLLQQPYWRRLWVMQELTLSDEPPEIVCGRARVSWESVVSVLRNYSSAYYITRLQSVRTAVRNMGTRGCEDVSESRARHLMFLLSHSAAF